MSTEPRQVGLQSPIITFADLLDQSQKAGQTALADFMSDETETPSNERECISDEMQEEEAEDDADEDENELSVTTTKNLLQISHIDGSLLERTMDGFYENFKNEIKEQFLSSRERLFRQTENEINSITKVYQQSVSQKEKELSTLKSSYNDLSEQHNKLNVEFSKLQSSHSDTKKKLSCVRQLSQTVMKWKNDCEKKKFVVDYINDTIIPNKRRIRMQRIYLFWKSQAMTQHARRYDEIWEKRLETVSKKIIEQYEVSIKQLREELNVKAGELQTLQKERAQQQQNMKRAFMRGVSALNLEAMSLFQHQHKNRETPGDQEIHDQQQRESELAEFGDNEW